MPPAHASTASSAFEASYPALVRFLARRTGNADEARDLAHDTWLRLATSRAPDEGVRHAPAYLFGAAHNLAIDHQRRGQHRAELVDAAALLVPTQTQDIADQLAHRQALQAVERALQALPERTRSVFLAHRLDGTGHDELAAQFGVSRSAIERDVQRAHAQVQLAMERWHGTPHAPQRRRGLGALLGVLGLVATGPLLWRVWQQQVLQWQQALATRRGQQLQQTWPDGSTLALDADTAVQARFYGNRRQVQILRGAVFFAVAHDAQRRFTVQAGDTLVTVLGTRFSVERDGAIVRVAVESGRVQVEPRPGAAAILLEAGESLSLGPQGLQRGTAKQVAPWRNGWLSFERTPLSQVAERLNRYRNQAIQVDGAVAALPVSGEIRIAQADEWLRLLPRVLPVQVLRQDLGTVQLIAR
nr:sigma-70 family RNA polymerase sigma factor [uncultured Albidiferax sp.]